MWGGRKFLIAQVTERSNLIADGFNINIFQFISDKLISFLHFIIDIITYLPEKFLQFLHEIVVLLLHFITGIFTYYPEKFFEFIHEKSDLLLRFITGFFTYLPDKFLPYIHEKLTILLHFITDTFTHLIQRICEINPSVLLDLIKQKLVLFLRCIKHILVYLSEKLDKILPPETRSEMIRYWLPLLLLVVIVACTLCLVLYVLFRCLPSICKGACICCRCFCEFCTRAFRVVYQCCSLVFNEVYPCFCCCLRHGGRTAGKMMKAPGRGGQLMLRSAFEASPRIYFQGLRAGQALVSNLV